MVSFSQLPAVKKDTIFGAPQTKLVPSYFVIALQFPPNLAWKAVVKINIPPSIRFNRSLLRVLSVAHLPISCNRPHTTSNKFPIHFFESGTGVLCSMNKWEYQNKPYYLENRVVWEPCKRRTACTLVLLYMLKFFLKMDYLKLISKNFKMPNIKNALLLLLFQNCLFSMT